MSWVKDLMLLELRSRLKSGLCLSTGPFVFRVKTVLPSVATGLARLYAEFPIVDDTFVDFDVSISNVTGLRRYYRPQVQFRVDGYTPFQPLPQDQAFAMLEWGLNWCIAVNAHHYLMLHAAVLERDGLAVVMPGEPGAGKSTLTAALMLSGWRLLSDEIALIDRHDGLVRGLARPVSLKNASIDVIRKFDNTATIGEAARDTHKGVVAHLKPSEESVFRVGEPAPPRWIVFPRWKPDTQAKFTPHSKASAFLHLASHAFNYSLLGPLGFRCTADLMDECSCWDFEYAQLPDAIGSFANLSP